MTKLSFLAGSIALFARGPRHNRPDAYSLLARDDDHLLKDIGLTAADLSIIRSR